MEKHERYPELSKHLGKCLQAIQNKVGRKWFIISDIYGSGVHRHDWVMKQLVGAKVAEVKYNYPKEPKYKVIECRHTYYNFCDNKPERCLYCKTNHPSPGK